MGAEPADPPVARCPICGRPADPRFRPFCSRRCRDQDLLNWFSGRYAVPAVETDDAEDDQDG
ncbi:MAG: DNA gyrase inhibitor YacG [Geminicoccaceae bacterium]